MICGLLNKNLIKKYISGCVTTDMEQIAEVIERLDNILGAMQMPFPDSTHMSGLREILPDVRNQLLEAYLKLGGENFWK